MIIPGGLGDLVYRVPRRRAAVGGQPPRDRSCPAWWPTLGSRRGGSRRGGRGRRSRRSARRRIVAVDRGSASVNGRPAARTPDIPSVRRRSASRDPHRPAGRARSAARGRAGPGSRVRHPVAWLTDLSGGGPVYALAILFGLNMVDEMDRDSLRPADPEHPEVVPHDQRRDPVAGGGRRAARAVADRADRPDGRQPQPGAADAHRAPVFALFSFGTGLAIFVWVLVIMRSGSGRRPGHRRCPPTTR